MADSEFWNDIWYSVWSVCTCEIHDKSKEYGKNKQETEASLVHLFEIKNFETDIFF